MGQNEYETHAIDMNKIITPSTLYLRTFQRQKKKKNHIEICDRIIFLMEHNFWIENVEKFSKEGNLKRLPPVIIYHCINFYPSFKSTCSVLSNTVKIKRYVESVQCVENWYFIVARRESFFSLSAAAAGDVDTVTVCFNVTLSHKSWFTPINKFLPFYDWTK